MYYKKATIDDIDILVKTRIIVLRAANMLTDHVDMTEVKEETYKYYEKALLDGSHTAFLVFEDEQFIGAGGISYFQVMPTYHNPSGKKAYIMNMYTDPVYRRQGIATRTLQLLVDDAKEKDVKAISLEATAAGRPLYEKFGFIEMRDEMEIPTD